MGRETGDGRRETAGSGERRAESTFGFRLLLLVFGFALGLAACSAPADSGQFTMTSEQSSVASNTPTSSSLLPIATPSPTHPSTSTPTPTTTPCPPDVCIYASRFPLARPIAPSGVDIIDPTYRYGSTQNGVRETHHGVEFVNPQGTPVLAAADGVVIVAGNDYQTPYANYPGFYGNLVIIEHQFPDTQLPNPLPVYTLYGHLYEVQAEVGQQVSAGDQIGLVGFTGWAVGEHLHFEVRYGENSYRKTRNPDLWLQPHNDENGEPHGVIAGRILDELGAPIYIPALVVEQISPEDGEILAAYYLETYADWTVNGDDNWNENFALGDLPAGKYRVSFVARGLQVYEVDVLPGQVTMIVFDAREQGE